MILVKLLGLKIANDSVFSIFQKLLCRLMKGHSCNFNGFWSISVQLEILLEIPQFLLVVVFYLYKVWWHIQLNHSTKWNECIKGLLRLLRVPKPSLWSLKINRNFGYIQPHRFRTMQARFIFCLISLPDLNSKSFTIMVYCQYFLHNPNICFVIFTLYD